MKRTWDTWDVAPGVGETPGESGKGAIMTEKTTDTKVYRDINIGQIGEQHIGQVLRVAGWVENIRDHGGVSFIDLRDMYGVLQVVLRSPKLLKGLIKETQASHRHY